MSNYDRSLIWLVLSVAMSRTYESGSLGWWFWSALFVFWALVVIAIMAANVANLIKRRRSA